MSIFKWFCASKEDERRKSQQDASGYHVFCRDFDKELDAANLRDVLGPLSPENEKALDAAWDELVFGLAPLRAKWLLNSLEAGQVLRASLPKEDLEDTVVSLLIDHSGSMKGSSITFTALAVDFVQEFLRHLGCKVEVLGFTTTSWKGGLSRARWIAAGKPGNPGRLCDLLHIIYRSADDMRVSPMGHVVRSMVRPDLLKENIDGEAIEWAASRLKLRPERRQYLLVISDGAPVDDSTLSANHNTFLWDHLKAVIARIMTEGAICIAGVGIAHDVQTVFPKSTKVDLLETLADAMLDLLKETMLAPVGTQAGGTTPTGEGSQWLTGRWKKATDETNEVYIQKLCEGGDMPLDIIKALRVNTGMGLEAAHKLVVSDREIEIFLRANRERGVERRGMIRLLRRVYGCTHQSAIAHIDRSGLWRETESLP